MAIKQALISVSDKSGVVEFAKGLNGLGIAIISSGGTAKTLSENKVQCKEISEITNFPEILDGRVKTLNPKIYGGILARRDNKNHLEELKKYSISPIDMVVVNLYPFEETLLCLRNNPPASLPPRREGIEGDLIPDEIIENIDIGGVALLRAAAKNFRDVLVICDPSDYSVVLDKIKTNSITQEFRLELASKAFRHTAYYDSIISGYFTKEKFPKQLSIPLNRISSLRYGENPHQEASVYKQAGIFGGSSVISATKLQGKELSYNNYLDLDSAWKLVCEFDQPVCAIIKHTNPCGCAQGKDILDAYQRALLCDPLSAFGGIIAVNREINEAVATEITKLFTECVIAPSFTDKAKQVFAGKKNLRILENPIKNSGVSKENNIEFRTISGGMLAQDKDTLLSNELKTITARKPSDIELESLKFAWKVCKYVKSNAIVLVRGNQTIGVGAGQMSRIDSMKISAEKMKSVKHNLNEKDFPLVLASDAFFPFPDVVNESAIIGVSAIIQPGGSIKDEDSIKAANDHNIAMLFTGMRHFRH